MAHVTKGWEWRSCPKPRGRMPLSCGGYRGATQGFQKPLTKGYTLNHIGVLIFKFQVHSLIVKGLLDALGTPVILALSVSSRCC